MSVLIFYPEDLARKHYHPERETMRDAITRSIGHKQLAQANFVAAIDIRFGIIFVEVVKWRYSNITPAQLIGDRCYYFKEISDYLGLVDNQLFMKEFKHDVELMVMEYLQKEINISLMQAKLAAMDWGKV